MSDLSNLYVEKINSEHPLAVWVLNEDIDYVSLISETQREVYNASSWTLTNGSASEEINPTSDTPFQDSALSRVAGNVPSGATLDITATSVFEVPVNRFSSELANFSFTFHTYIDTPYANSVSFGYKYYDPIAEITVEEIVTDTLTNDDANTWKFFANTFGFPPANADDIYFIIRFNVSTGGGTGDYDFLINGMTLGQWSEEFHKESLGLVPDPLPTDIAIDANMQVIPAFPYGASNRNAYYTACENDRRLYTVNFGVPLVYGSDNTTKIYPHQHVVNNETITYPSLIFPGYGFLNDFGRYNEYTAEMWIRINTDAVNPRKIFGPISSNDGLYVEGPFLTFVIGKGYASHYVGEWFRPMLVHIRYIRNNVSVLVNGEEVFDIDFNENSVPLAAKLDSQGRDQDWLGFYGYDDVRPIEVDSVAIYSYSVPNEVAKRRWVWGQGVVAPETTNSALNARTAFADYAFSQYTANYNYPDFANWGQAFFSNVETSSSALSLPEYEFPDCVTPGFTKEQWFDDLQAAQTGETEKYFSFRPNSNWDNLNTYGYLREFGVLADVVESFYQVLQSDGNASNEILFKIIDKSTSDYLQASINGTTVTYLANIAGSSETIATKTITANEKFVAGINVSKVALLNIPGINRFFSDQNGLEIYLCGDGNGSSFTGRTYRIGFDASYNNRKISNLYDASGIFHSTTGSVTALMAHVANYTTKAYEKYGIFFNDIAVSGYWEDYMPLSYFAKNIDNFEGQTNYEFDSIQFNLDYPEGLEVDSLESVSSWTYGDLKVRYQAPVQLTYTDLSNNFYTGWDDYEDMSQDSEKYYFYDTNGATVRSYVSFQYIDQGANKNLVDFTNYAVPRVSGIVNPTEESTQWEDTAFELVDGAIVYPPETDQSGNAIDFNDLAIVYHLDFISEGITHHPIRFRDLQLASQVLERAIFTEIGTKFGTPVFPYKKLGLYYDFKGDNPISIYKESTPYLFMNRHSGWRVRGGFAEKPQNQLAVITGAVGDGTTVTYQSNNSFIAGQRVTITGLSTAAGSSLNLNNVVIAAATSAGFTVLNNTVGVASGSGIATVEFEGFIVVDRGITIPINSQRGLETEVSAVQMWLRFSERVFPQEEIPVFAIEFNTATYQFYVKQDQSGQRGYIIARDLATNQIIENVSYFVNGKPVDVPYLVNEEWGVLGVSFADPLDFSSRAGRINLNGPLTYNNISYYLSTNLERIQRVTPRSWAAAGEETWEYWTDFNWSQVQTISSSTQYAIDPAEIYQRYVGTNRVVVDDNIDGLFFDPDLLTAYSDVTWSTSTRIPV